MRRLSFGGLDILVNNAGIAVIGDVESLSLEDFDRQLAINVRAVFVASQRAIPHLGSDGRIINIGSINADRVPGPGLASYSMTKAAVAGLTRGLARDLGPGASRSAMSARARQHRSESDEGAFAESPRRSWRPASTASPATSQAW